MCGAIRHTNAIGPVTLMTVAVAIEAINAIANLTLLGSTPRLLATSSPKAKVLRPHAKNGAEIAVTSSAATNTQSLHQSTLVMSPIIQ
jgi:hypothetical protein